MIRGKGFGGFGMIGPSRGGEEGRCGDASSIETGAVAGKLRDLPATARHPTCSRAVPSSRQAEVLNRTDRARTVVVSSHVVSPSGDVVYKSDVETVELAGGEKRPWPVTVPGPPTWCEGLYPAFVTVGDSDQRRQIHQAPRYIPVAGSVQLKLTSDRPGYQIGERAAFEIEASSASLWSGATSGSPQGL